MKGLRLNYFQSVMTKKITFCKDLSGKGLNDTIHYTTTHYWTHYVHPLTGQYHPSYHSEVVRAELDQPLGHIWMLDIIPPYSLIIRNEERVKEVIMRDGKLVLHFCTVTLSRIRPKRTESSCIQQRTNIQCSGCTTSWLGNLLF